jgi:hypothetical protein
LSKRGKTEEDVEKVLTYAFFAVKFGEGMKNERNRCASKPQITKQEKRGEGEVGEVIG